MIDVLTMPPVKYTARAQGFQNARSVSQGLVGTRYTSQYKRSRRQFSVTIDASERQLGFAGYLEQLRRYQDTKAPLMQIEVQPDIWHFDIHALRRDRGHGEIQWDYNSLPFEWLYTNIHLNIFYSGFDVVSGSDYGGFYIETTTPTPNTLVAYVGEEVVQGDVVGRVVNMARADASGNVKIYVDTEFQTGHLQISPPKWAFAYIDDMPISQQDTGGSFDFSLSMTEVFEDEYEGGFNVVQPWR